MCCLDCRCDMNAVFDTNYTGPQLMKRVSDVSWDTVLYHFDDLVCLSLSLIPMVEEYIITNDNRYLEVKDIGLEYISLFLSKWNLEAYHDSGVVLGVSALLWEKKPCFTLMLGYLLKVKVHRWKNSVYICSCKNRQCLKWVNLH